MLLVAAHTLGVGSPRPPSASAKPSIPGARVELEPVLPASEVSAGIGHHVRVPGLRSRRCERPSVGRGWATSRRPRSQANPAPSQSVSRPDPRVPWPGTAADRSPLAGSRPPRELAVPDAHRPTLRKEPDHERSSLAQPGSSGRDGAQLVAGTWRLASGLTVLLDVDASKRPGTDRHGDPSGAVSRETAAQSRNGRLQNPAMSDAPWHPPKLQPRPPARRLPRIPSSAHPLSALGHTREAGLT